MSADNAARAGHRVFLILGVVFLALAAAPKFTGLGFNRTFLYVALAFLLVSSALRRRSRPAQGGSGTEASPRG
jgi:hypothetical protein